nr:amidophosphoribosyltransferase [Myxococcaceae bacterium]
SRKELIAASHTTEEIARYVTADSLAYLTEQGLVTAAGDATGRSFCTACFTGKYLTPLAAGPPP